MAPGAIFRDLDIGHQVVITVERQETGPAAKNLKTAAANQSV
jgi:cold shock CspA family protein